MPDEFSYKRHADDHYVDGVSIRLVPWYKTSGLSGDGWRVSAVLNFTRKGHVVYTHGFRNIEDACAGAAWFLKIYDEREDFTRVPDAFTRVPDALNDSLCFQPGCWENARVIFRIKQEYTEREGVKKSSSWPEHRAFCALHVTRGDCGLEDADSNYEEVEKISK